jgi:hypothetical protein
VGSEGDAHGRPSLSVFSFQFPVSSSQLSVAGK